MVCIYCANETKVINSRPQKRTNTVWRRRRCLVCGSTITTEEVPRYESTLVVRHPQGALEPFSRDKLLISLYKSLAHRTSAQQDASALTGTVITLLHGKDGHGAAIDRSELVALATTCLERFDAAAGSHYRAYHPITD